MEIKVFMGVVKKWKVPATGKFDYERRVIRITRNRDNFRIFYQNTAVVGKNQIKDTPK
jgi:hypothetical protein